MKKAKIVIMLTALCLFCLACAKNESVSIILPENASEQHQLAAKEIRRYLYQRTDQLVDILKSDRLPETAKSVIVVAPPDASFAKDFTATLSQQEYRIVSTKIDGHRALLILGDETGILYGAYRFAEHLGVRFYLHGDVIPDEKIPLRLPNINEQRKPLFELRGIHPFHDFPEGPDWWNLDDYKAVLAQLPKMGMNFFALHTYPDNQPIYGEEKGPEPVVWIGREEDINTDGTVRYSSQVRHFTTQTNTWGYARMNTSDFHLGAAQLFERENFGADYMIDRTPWPKTAEDRNLLFDEFGDLLGDAFTFSHRLGVKTCVGTELTLSIPQVVKDRLITMGKNPDDPATVRQIYQGMFRWIEKNYPLDYYWLWTHEGWTWSEISDDEVERTEQDLRLAYEALENVGKPFDLATCGWVLGPPKDRTQFDRVLPKDVAFSAINRQLGKEPVDRNFANVKNRPTWAIPWLEDDPRMISPQLWAGRMRRDAYDALAYGCSGLLGIHWRTRMLEPTVSALAQAGWDQHWADAFPEPHYGDENVLAFATGQAITGETTLQPPFDSVRDKATAYHFKVPNGLYTVTLYFIEPVYDQSGQRVFSIRLQGDRLIERYDIIERAGTHRPTQETFRDIRVNDGELVVDFMVKVGDPCIAGIHVEGEGQSIKLNCGAAEQSGDWSAEPQPLEPPSRSMPVDDFYLDWARVNFGRSVAGDVADIFIAMDGNLHEPAQWIDGPGGIQTFQVPWQEIEKNYAFVDELSALRDRVEGAGNLHRFDYWLYAFQFMRATARVGCRLGELDKLMLDMTAADASARSALAREKGLPIRLQLAQDWTSMVGFLLNYVDTPGDLGTVANMEQHNWLALNLMHKHDEQLEQWLDASLPKEAFLPTEYQGKTRLFVPTKRTVLEAGESLNLKIIVLSSQQTPAPILHWKRLGDSTFIEKTAEHVARGVYKVLLPDGDIAGDDFEYYISLPGADGVTYPATAPSLNHSVVVF